MDPRDGGSPDVLVAAGDGAFANTVVDGIEAADPPVAAEAVDPAVDPTERAAAADPACVVVDGAATDPVGTVDRLTDEVDPAVVLLTDGGTETVSAAVDAGVDDVFPRVEADGAYELVADRVADLADGGGRYRDGDEDRDGGGDRDGDVVQDGDEDGTGDVGGDGAWRDVFENVSDGLVVHDAETGEILDVNERFCEMNDRDRTELIGGDVGLVTAPGDEYSFEAVREQIAKARETGSRLVEWRNRRPDGETSPVEVHLAVVELGGTERVLASVRDITERKRREREYEQVFDAVQDAILVMDPETLEIIDANEAYRELFGYDDLETIRELGVEGLSFDGAGYTVDEGHEIHRRVAETGDPELVEWRGETKDGDPIWLEVKVAPAVINGEQVNVAINRDVTDRRRLERRFRTIAERVEEVIYLANADLTEVLYVNEAYADVFGHPTDDLDEDPRAFLDAVHPEDRDRYEADLRAMLEEIEAGDPDDRYEFEYRVRSDGEVSWVEQTGYPIAGERGVPHRFVGITTDVTERHRRERTLETFHEATRELTAAGSRTEACRQAVRAAEDVLGFPLVSAYLYDETEGALEPEAVTNRLADLDVDLPAFGPGESLPWQAFVDGEAVTGSEMAVPVYGPGVSTPDVVLPLGSHGVMLVGAPSGEFTDEDVELAQILAATLEAALNHVEGERELAEREAELRRQRERAERLRGLNEIIRDVEQATIERSSRTGIEEAVCERLVDVDVHDLVWIAEPSVGDDELVPRARAGGETAYLDALTTEFASGSSVHPAVTAYRQAEPRVIENVATDVTTDEYRTHALGHGVQSVVAVPIRYESRVHGVLSVESSDPDAFDESTRDVLAELGRSIGYAITVVEREQALESEGTTELKLSVSDAGLFMIRGASAADCRVSLERTIRRSGGSFSMLYVVESGDPDAVVEVGEAAPSIESAQVLSRHEADDRGLIEVTATTWFGSVFTEHGAVVREATAEPDGGTLIVEAPHGTDVRTLVEGFRERYPDTELVAQRQRDRTIRSLFELQDLLREELTERQWEALETAYSAGYFSWPREVSGEGVADLLDVSQPTFNKHLRIAERTAFRMLLDREYPDDG